MDRLTKRSGEMVWIKGEHKGKPILLEPCDLCHSAGDIRKILVRLAAYEDTGIEPQDMVMEMEYGDKKVRLRRCPFCGSAPLIHGYRNRMRQWYRIRCSNEKEICRMIPETSASRTLEEAATDWNMMPKDEMP